MLDLPALDGDIRLLVDYFSDARESPELRNPHIEPRVGAEVRGRARPAAVLIAAIARDNPTILVTRRHNRIRFAGHVCFPGGTVDPGDASPIETALRETGEEIGLDPAAVEVLGCLGDYYTQTGYCITPVVGLLHSRPTLVPNPAEVDEIYEISFARMLNPENYRLTWRNRERGHISWHEGDIRIAGPTVSIMIGLYESLAGRV